MIFVGKRKIIAAILAFAFLGSCGWFWRHRESIPFISQPLSVAAAPFEYGTSRFSKAGTTGIGIIDEALHNWNDLEALKKENGALRAEQAKYSEILAENIRLRSLLKFKQGYTGYNLLGVSVIARDYGGWTNTLLIDRGADDGLKKYMPVIVPEGVIGFVSEVYKNSSRVQLLLDPRTSIGGIVQRPASRVASIVTGNSGSPDSLSFINLSREADVVKGDLILTSGYGGVYPKGLIIGTVENVDTDPTGVTLQARIKPAADFSHLEEAFVITDQIQQVKPDSTDNNAPRVEPPMNPNNQQAGDK